MPTDHAGTIFRSSLLDQLGVPHAFTTRAWDVKQADDVRQVLRATRLVARPDQATVRLRRQVHGNVVTLPDHPCGEADAHVTDRPGEVVAVRTADCVPILFAAAGGSAVAAVHAGWRGLDPAVNVIRHTAAALSTLNAADPPDRWAAAVGPCIRGRRYEVGEDVAARFRDAYPDALDETLGPRPHLDLRAVTVAQLLDAGLDPDHLDVFPGCTHDDADDFFSYRREGQGVGHQAALITPRSLSNP
jgi:YfiH family protein